MLLSPVYLQQTYLRKIYSPGFILVRFPAQAPIGLSLFASVCCMPKTAKPWSRKFPLTQQ